MAALFRNFIPSLIVHIHKKLIMEIQGKLHVKFDTVVRGEKFSSRQFVVEYSDNPMYPQYISFELTQDRCAELDKFKVGDKVNVTFNLRGREWKSPTGDIKYFNTLEAWRIVHEGADQNPVAYTAKNSIGIEDKEDDLPF